MASFPMPERDHWLPQPSGPLPGRSFPSWARPFAQLLPRQLRGQGRPLGTDLSLLTRPREGWVTTYKPRFLKDRKRWRLHSGLPTESGARAPKGCLLASRFRTRSPHPSLRAALGSRRSPLPRLLWAHGGCCRRHSVAPAGQPWGPEGGRLRGRDSETVGAGTGRSGLPPPPGLQMSRRPAPEGAPRAGGGQWAQQEQVQSSPPAPNTGREAVRPRAGREMPRAQGPGGLEGARPGLWPRTQPPSLSGPPRGVKGGSIFSF